MKTILSLKKNKLFRNTAIYTTSTVIRSGIPFLLLPILTRFLSPKDYGIVANFQVILPLVTVIIGVQTHGAIAVNYFQLDTIEIRNYTSNVSLIILGNLVISLGIVFLLGPRISGLTGIENFWLIMAVIAGFSQVAIHMLLTLWQTEQRPAHYGIFQILHVCLDVILSLALVILYSLTWRGRLSGIIFASISFAIVSIVVLVRKGYLRSSFDPHYIKDALFFGIPLVPAALGRWVITATDRLFLTKMVGLSATGLYTAGYQVGMIIYLIYSFLIQPKKQTLKTTI